MQRRTTAPRGVRKRSPRPVDYGQIDHLSKRRLELKTKGDFPMSDDKGWDEFPEEIDSFIKGDEANPKTGGKHNEAKLIEEFASKIKASTSRSVQEILKRGAYCVQAEKQLSPEGNETL